MGPSGGVDEEDLAAPVRSHEQPAPRVGPDGARFPERRLGGERSGGGGSGHSDRPRWAPPPCNRLRRGPRSTRNPLRSAINTRPGATRRTMPRSMNPVAKLVTPSAGRHRLTRSPEATSASDSSSATHRPRPISSPVGTENSVVSVPSGVTFRTLVVAQVQDVERPVGVHVQAIGIVQRNGGGRHRTVATVADDVRSRHRGDDAIQRDFANAVCLFVGDVQVSRPVGQGDVRPRQLGRGGRAALELRPPFVQIVGQAQAGAGLQQRRTGTARCPSSTSRRGTRTLGDDGTLAWRGAPPLPHAGNAAPAVIKTVAARNTDNGRQPRTGGDFMFGLLWEM